MNPPISNQQSPTTRELIPSALLGTCPLPLSNYREIVLAHGSGGKLSQELLAHSHISTTADIYVHGRREAKAGKATELLASQFVPVFSEEPVVEEQELVSEMVQ